MPPRLIPAETPETRERFESYVERRGPDECHFWTGGKFRQGYGAFSLEGQAFRAHRVAYVWRHGEYGDGDLDHICHDPAECPGGFECPHRACVNENHLVPASRRQNVLRGGGPTAVNAAKEVSRSGNDLDYIDPRGWRSSKADRRAATDRYQDKNRDEINRKKREARVRVVYDERPCASCGEPFTPERSTGRFCARRACVNKRQRERKD